jgi:DNA invertase Pin-like site-specific DNA recombinase
MTVIGYVFLRGVDAGDIEVERQSNSLVRYAATQRMQLDHIFVEQGFSLKRSFAERKQGREMLRHLLPGDTIITESAQYVFGSAREGLRLVTTLQGKGVSLYCIDLDENISLPQERKLVVSEGNAALIKKVLNALAECESCRHGESIKAAKRKMKREGRYLGGPVPFGWNVKEGYLVRDSEQQKILREIQKMRADRWSYRDIAAQLKDRFGVKLSHEGIRKIVMNNT